MLGPPVTQELALKGKRTLFKDIKLKLYSSARRQYTLPLAFTIFVGYGSMTKQNTNEQKRTNKKKKPKKQRTNKQ